MSRSTRPGRHEPTRTPLLRYSGGCITRRWSDTLCMAEQVLDLLSDQPDLMYLLEGLYDRHEKRLPKLMGWGSAIATHQPIDRQRTVSIMTSCMRGKGLRSSCWISSGRLPLTPRSRR